MSGRQMNTLVCDNTGSSHSKIFLTRYDLSLGYRWFCCMAPEASPKMVMCQESVCAGGGGQNFSTVLLINSTFPSHYVCVLVIRLNTTRKVFLVLHPFVNLITSTSTDIRRAKETSAFIHTTSYDYRGFKLQHRKMVS